jgi:hypothetical protein
MTEATPARTEIWVDGHYLVIEIYTGDTLSPPRRRLGLGTEPMTRPPNAFQTGKRAGPPGTGPVADHDLGTRLRSNK